MAKAKRGPKGRFVKASHKRRRRRAHKASAAPRRRRRRSHGGKRRPAVGYVVGSKRIRRRKLNPRRRYRRRHNPRFSVAGITGQLMPAVWGGLGGIANDVGFGYVSGFLPAMFQSGYGKSGAKIANALLIGWIARKFLGARGAQVAHGALTVAVYQLLKDVTVQFAPTLPGLGDYEQITIPDTGNIAGYVPGTTVGAYLPDGSVAQGMGAYLGGVDPTENMISVSGLDY